MEISDFVFFLKSKYNYSSEFCSFLEKAIYSLIKYYGEDKRELIFGVLSECEIHIQKENENVADYLNNYFGVNKKWDIPFLGGSFLQTELFVRDNFLCSKSIIFIICETFDIYKPFDISEDESMSSIIHEICHAIKSYGRIKVENGNIIAQSGLINDYYSYDSTTNTFSELFSTNQGLEEALNSYDEAEVMSILTGVTHLYGGYVGMSEIARMLMEHKEFAKVVRKCQFLDCDDWIHFLGESNAKFIVQNFDDWVNILYRPIDDLMNDDLDLMSKKEQAVQNLLNFVKEFNSLSGKLELDNKVNIPENNGFELITHDIIYNSESGQFEEIVDGSARNI